MTARTLAPPAGRYPTLIARPGTDPARAVDDARRLAGGEAVLWVHETVHDDWQLPASPDAGHAARFPGARQIGGSGWLICDEGTPIHVAFPRYSGDFAGYPTPDAMGCAVEAWRKTLGAAYLYSAASTIHALIRGLEHPPVPDPEPDLGYARPRWAAAGSWGIGADVFEIIARRAGYVRCFDRSGTYLAAWSGLRLGIGTTWNHAGPGELTAGPEGRRPPGYWLIDRRHLPEVGLFDPFARLGDPTQVWLTTPLAQLATDIAGDKPIPVADSWVQDVVGRPLDAAAARIRDARSVLTGPALDALKVGYAGATAWFEHGAKAGKPLARPHWGRSIIDRAIANTWRSVQGWTPGPAALVDIDTVLVAVDSPDSTPYGMRTGSALGAWKPAGRALTADDAAAAYTAGGARAVARLADQ